MTRATRVWATAGGWKKAGSLNDVIVVPPPPPPKPDATSSYGAPALGTATTLPLPANAVYMATTGSDLTGNGTAAAPYKSLAKAVSAAVSGGTVVVRGGVYSDGSTTQTKAGSLGLNISTKSVTIQNYPGEVVWFDGSRVASSWNQDATTGFWWTDYDRVFDRSPTNARGAADGTSAGWQWVNPSYPLAPVPDQCWFDGVPQTLVGTQGQLGAGKFWVEGTQDAAYWFTATKLWVGTNPVGHTVNVSDKVTLLALGYPNCTVRGIGFRRYSNSNPDYGIITATREYAWVDKCYFQDIASDAIFFAGAGSGGTTTRRCDHGKVTSTTLQRVGALPIGANMADNFLLQDCDITEANTHRWNQSPQAGGFKMTRSQFPVLNHNRFDRCYVSKAIWFDQTCHEVQVTNNLLTNIGAQGMHLEVSNGGLVANNLLVNVARHGIQANDVGRTVRIWNNTIRNVGAGYAAIRLDQDTRTLANDTMDQDGRQPASYYSTAGNDWRLRNVQIVNNVCSVTSSTAAQSFLGYLDQNSSSGTALPASDYTAYIDGNVYHRIAAPPAPWMWAASTTTSGSVTYTTFSTWQSRPEGFDSASSLVTSGEILDSTYRLISTVYAGNAEPIPSDIAALIGVAAGTREAGVI